MLQRHEDKFISIFWSERMEKELMMELWKEHRKLYGPLEVRPPLKSEYPRQSHEVVQTLIEACLKLQDGDLHWGLTSSDVVDYVRIKQLGMTMDYVRGLMVNVQDEMDKFFERCDVECLGYTHLLPAAPVRMGRRFFHLYESLEALKVGKPHLTFKPLSGPVGAARFETPLGGARQKWCNQTTNGTTYMEAAFWFAQTSRILYKFAQDLRVLLGSGELVLRSDVGSSAMAHKENPTKLERICSLAMRQPGFVNEVWLATATSILERTLTDSALLRNVLPEMSHNVARQLVDFMDCLPDLNVDVKKVKSLLKAHREVRSYDDLTKLSSKVPRIDAYFLLKSKHKK